MVCKELGIPGTYFISGETREGDSVRMELYNRAKLAAIGIRKVFSTHFEMVFNKKNILRGFNIQDAPLTQTILMRCVKGRCQIVLLDAREDSKSYYQTVDAVLDGDQEQFLYICSGVAYAILSLSDDTELYCLTDNMLSSTVNILINPFDPKLNCQWMADDFITSLLTRKAPTLGELPHNYW